MDILRQTRERIVAQDQGPFVAGLLTFPRVAAAVQRAGGIVSRLPRIPLRLLDVAADPSRTEHLVDLLPRPARRQITRELQAAFKKAVDVGAVRPLADEAIIRAIAPLFTVHQSDKDRLIYDLRALNASITDDPTFSMQTIYDVPAIAAGCTVGGKADLRSAYWQYPLSPDLAAVLGVDAVQGITDHPTAWHVLPFGLDVAPKTWTALMAPFVEAWRRRGIRVIVYLDDIAVFAPDSDTFARHTAIVVDDLAAAGIRISSDKSFFVPFRKFEFLGVTIDLADGGAFTISEERIARLARQADEILADPAAADAHELASFLGRATFVSVTCPWLSFYRTALVAALTAACPQGLPRRHPGRSIVVSWTPDALAELRWWRDQAGHLLRRSWPWTTLAVTRSFASRGAPLAVPIPATTAASDASDTGIGLRVPITLPDGSTRDVLLAEALPSWLPPDSPSAARELFGLARLLELRLIRPTPNGIIRLITDSQAAAGSWAGTTATPLTARAARRLFVASLQVGCPVIVDWSPREALGDCDAGSRLAARDASHATPPADWVRFQLRRHLGSDHADAEFFTSASNRLFPAAASGSRLPDPSAAAGDGVSSPFWASTRCGWAFPPFALRRAVVTRVASMPQPPRALLLLPDSPITRSLPGYTFLPGPPHLLAPPDFRRRMTPPLPLVLCVPPLQAPGSVPSTPRTQRRRRAAAMRMPPRTPAPHAAPHDHQPPV